MSSKAFQANRSVGVYGGSFDPLHIGHVEFIEKILNELKFNKVIVVPCKQHPFNKNFLFSNEQRLQMLSNVFSKKINIEICDFEIKSTETSYTINTLEFLKKKYTKITFICGVDTFEKIESWKDYKRLFELADFIVVKRNGTKIEINKILSRLNKLNINNIELVDLNLPNISSTEIKAYINQGIPIDSLLPKENKDIKII